MVQQKIVIKVQMNSEKCRTKAMKIAATTDGTQLQASNSIYTSLWGFHEEVVINIYI
jgi:hypothetical protein